MDHRILASLVKAFSRLPKLPGWVYTLYFMASREEEIPEILGRVAKKIRWFPLLLMKDDEFIRALRRAYRLDRLERVLSQADGRTGNLLLDMLGNPIPKRLKCDSMKGIWWEKSPDWERSEIGCEGRSEICCEGLAQIIRFSIRWKKGSFKAEYVSDYVELRDLLALKDLLAKNLGVRRPYLVFKRVWEIKPMDGRRERDVIEYLSMLTFRKRRMFPPLRLVPYRPLSELDEEMLAGYRKLVPVEADEKARKFVRVDNSLYYMLSPLAVRKLLKAGPAR